MDNEQKERQKEYLRECYRAREKFIEDNKDLPHLVDTLHEIENESQCETNIDVDERSQIMFERLYTNGLTQDDARDLMTHLMWPPAVKLRNCLRDLLKPYDKYDRWGL